MLGVPVVAREDLRQVAEAADERIARDQEAIVQREAVAERIRVDARRERDERERDRAAAARPREGAFPGPAVGSRARHAAAIVSDPLWTPRLSPAGGESPRPEPAIGLGGDEREAVAALNGGPPQSMEIGPARLVHAAAGECCRGEAAPHLGLGGRRSRHCLGVREVCRCRTEVLADQLDRPIELVRDHARIGPVEQGVRVGMGSDSDQPGADGVTQPAHDTGGAPHGNGSPESMKCVAAYSVTGSWNSTSEGTTVSQKSAVPSSKVSTTWRSAGAEGDVSAANSSGAASSGDHAMVLSEVVELPAERGGIEVDLAARPAADAVVDEDDDAGDRLPTRSPKANVRLAIARLLTAPVWQRRAVADVK